MSQGVWVRKSKELRLLCNASTSQVEGILVAITKLHCQGLDSNGSLVLRYHEGVSCPVTQGGCLKRKPGVPVLTQAQPRFSATTVS